MRRMLLLLGLVVVVLLSSRQTSAACPTNFCQQAKLECQESCAPCGSATACYAYVCDASCYCQC